MKSYVPATLALALASAAAITLTAAPAQAAPTSPSLTRGWEFFDDYYTHDGCMTAGQQGKDRGEWTNYQCRSSIVDWNLWVYRP